MVTSAFAFAECASGLLWGRISDRVGRKKVLLGGMFGTGISMLLFGFAKSLPMAIFARALGGILNGQVHQFQNLYWTWLTWCSNIGVIQTTVAEMITEEAQQREFEKNLRTWNSKLTSFSESVFHCAICLVSRVCAVWISVPSLYDADSFTTGPSSVQVWEDFSPSQSKTTPPCSNRTRSSKPILTSFRTLSVPPLSYSVLWWEYFFSRRHMKTRSTNGTAGSRPGDG